MKDYIKLTDDNVQEYIDTIYSFMHNKWKIKFACIENNFELAKTYRNENKKLFEIVDMLSELAYLNSSE